MDALLDDDVLEWLARQDSQLAARPADDAQSYVDFDAHWEALCRGDWELPQPTPLEVRAVDDAIVGPSTGAMFSLRARWPDGHPIDINILLLGFLHVSTGPFDDGVPVINVLQAAAGRAPRPSRWKGKVSMRVEVLVQNSTLPGFPTILADRTPAVVARQDVDAPPPRVALEQLAVQLAPTRKGGDISVLGAGVWMRAFDTRVLSTPAIDYPALERAHQLWDAHSRDLVPNRSELYELFMGQLHRPGAAAAAEYLRDELFAGEAGPFAAWYAWHKHISSTQVGHAETRLGPAARAELLAAIVIRTRPARPWIRWEHLSGIATDYYALLLMLGPDRGQPAWPTPKRSTPNPGKPRACVICAGMPETEHIWRVLHALMGAEPAAPMPRTRTGRVELRDMLVGPHQTRPPTDLDELLTRMRLPRTRHTF